MPDEQVRDEIRDRLQRLLDELLAPVRTAKNGQDMRLGSVARRTPTARTVAVLEFDPGPRRR